jgi:hypothetical protein
MGSFRKSQLVAAVFLNSATTARGTKKADLKYFGT